AIARTLIAHRPGARVVASDVDERAIACAAANGVEVYRGDLFAPLPRAIEGRVDVVIGVVPYVPTPALALLQRDTFAFESPLAYVRNGGRRSTMGAQWASSSPTSTPYSRTTSRPRHGPSAFLSMPTPAPSFRSAGRRSLAPAAPIG